MIGLDDIAWFATHTFDHWHAGDSHDLAIAADALTGPEIADHPVMLRGLATAGSSCPAGRRTPWSPTRERRSGCPRARGAQTGPCAV
ncbi:MAG TPA: hypothetical protein VNO31_14730 [Umezawaea sp.]|nr:hypothetical protein [Umezawaea sp.]